MLSLINASVSHELRNPLNSIVAQNSLKAFLYNKLKELCEKPTLEDKTESSFELIQIKKVISDVYDELSKGLEV